MKNQSIIIAPYDAAWPELFNKEKKLIEHALGKNALAIEHIGSTAVQGLAAKPIIDIMIGVADLSGADKHALKPLIELGYEYVPEYEVQAPDRRYFRKRTIAGVTQGYNIHMVVLDSPFFKSHLAFRNYLRTHPDVVLEYAALKKKLAAQHTDTNEYAQAKSAFIRAAHDKLSS